jgi:hypothetical protein
MAPLGLAALGVVALSLFNGAAAKTDYDGCTSFTSMVTVNPEPGYGNTYQTVIYFMTENLEICQGVDCGGGRAPPKTVPGCPAYKGTETVTPKFLSTNPLAPPPPASTVQTTVSTDASGNQGGPTAGTSTTPAPTGQTTPPPAGQTTGAGNGPGPGQVTSSTQSTAAAAPTGAAGCALNLAVGAAAAMLMI